VELPGQLLVLCCSSVSFGTISITFPLPPVKLANWFCQSWLALVPACSSSFAVTVMTGLLSSLVVVVVCDVVVEGMT
jgi:hypothetical protein